ncbi:MAG: hypothetical protein KDA87_17405 [Planctomycetales bacterium]|nr:hypothetical protein [Planctomycetales bacterium]
MTEVAGSFAEVAPFFPLPATDLTRQGETTRRTDGRSLHLKTKLAAKPFSPTEVSSVSRDGSGKVS